jgi:hypothetical protein
VSYCFAGQTLRKVAANAGRALFGWRGNNNTMEEGLQ